MNYQAAVDWGGQDSKTGGETTKELCAHYPLLAGFPLTLLLLKRSPEEMDAGLSGQVVATRPLEHAAGAGNRVVLQVGGVLHGKWEREEVGGRKKRGVGRKKG